MRRIGPAFLYLTAALLGIVIATAGALPASVAAAFAVGASKGQLSLANVAGSALHGRADATIQGLAPGQPPLTVRNIEWTIDKWHLLWGEVVCVLKSKGPELNGAAEVTRGFGHVTARNVQFELPASLITANVPEAKGWTTPGVVVVKSELLTIGSGGINGAAELNWRGAQAPDLGNIGEYRAVLKGSGAGPVAVELRTMQGQLRLDGRGEFTFSKGLRMGVTIDIQGPSRDRLLPFLALIGSQRPDGTVAIEINSQSPGRPAAGMKQS